MTRTAYRFRIAVVCLGLATLAFVQDPGRIAADTKLDLTLNPWGFMERALHLWDPMGFFGQVQNQAYGYFFPIGPLFGLGEAIDVPGWAIQRTWWAIVLVVGFLGVVRLSRHMGIESPLARVLAGLAYVLSARFLTTIGPISSETWPASLIPWCLVPLASTSRMGPRSRGLRAAVPVLLAGGVNGVATLATLVLPALWFLSRRWSRGVAQLAAWWLLGVVSACAWWLIPLLALGSVSPPFLDWIESSTITTRFTDVSTVLRGTTSWVAYLTDPSGPVWQAGWHLVTTPSAVVAQCVIAAVGLVGLSRWRGHDRWFLSVSLIAGLILVGLGHVGPADGLGAGTIRELLDGVLAPLRNTHKFQPIPILVLCLGIGGLVSEFSTARTWRPGRVPQWTRVVAVSAVGISLAVVAMPALTGSLTRGRTYMAVPGYWREAADWLAREGSQGRALVLPGASTGDYLWGRSQDEPLQGLASTPWAVRDSVPLSSAGNIRLLDEVEARIGAGQGSPGLTAALARSGVRFLLVRNDLDDVATSAPRRGLVRRALRQSPGLLLRATFGPPIQGFQTTEIVSPESQELPFAAVEIWEVGAQSAADRSLTKEGVGLRALSGSATLAGGPESLPALGDAQELPDGPLLLDGDDVGSGAGRSLVTDSPRRSEVAFGLMRDNRTASMTDDDPYQSARRVHDYVVDGAQVPIRSALTSGIATASASRSQVTSPIAIDPGSKPDAAIDGDPMTAWRSPLMQSVGSWWRLDLPESADLRGNELSIAFVADGTAGGAPRSVRVETAAGSVDSEVAETDDLQRVPVPSGPSSWLRVGLVDVYPDRSAVSFGIREVAIEGSLNPATQSDAGVRAAVKVPGTTSARPSTVVLTARTGERGACVLVGLANACDPFLARQGEERTVLSRVVDVPADPGVRVRVRPRPGPALDALLAPENGSMRVTASSSAVVDPAGRPAVAADRDLGTTWVAGPHDDHPGLRFEFPEPRPVSGLVFLTSPGAPASSPFKVTVGLGGREATYFVSSDGTLRLPRTITDRVTIEFGFTSPRRGFDPISGQLVPYPVGVGEVVVMGADDLRPNADPGRTIRVPCGGGPSIRIGDGVVPTSVETTEGAILDGLVVEARACVRPNLPAGTTSVVARASSAFLVDQVVLEPTDGAGEQSSDVLAQPDLRQNEATRRVMSVKVAEEDRVLELGENFNSGWRAELSGQALGPVRVDGWRQAWVVPAGAAGDVVVTFAPDRVYRAGLTLGALAALLLLVLVCVPGRWIRGGRVAGSHPGAAPRDRWQAFGLGAGLVLISGVTGLVLWITVLLVGPDRRAWARGVGIGVGMTASAAVGIAWIWPAIAPGWAAWVAALGSLIAVVLGVCPLSADAGVTRPARATQMVPELVGLQSGT